MTKNKAPKAKFEVNTKQRQLQNDWHYNSNSCPSILCVMNSRTFWVQYKYILEALRATECN